MSFCSQSSPLLDQDSRHPALARNVNLGQQIPLKFDAVVHGRLPIPTLSSGLFSSKPASGIINRNAADFIPGLRPKRFGMKSADRAFSPFNERASRQRTRIEVRIRGRAVQNG
jgi:hypothetical protein